MRRTLSQKRSISGKKGGIATLNRFGTDYYRYIGHEGGMVGGRPRVLSLIELRVFKSIHEGGNG